MRVVSENSDTDLARERATRQVDWALRDLTANLMRVTLGAGKPYEIGRLPRESEASYSEITQKYDTQTRSLGMG